MSHKMTAKTNLMEEHTDVIANRYPRRGKERLWFTTLNLLVSTMHPSAK